MDQGVPLKVVGGLMRQYLGVETAPATTHELAGSVLMERLTAHITLLLDQDFAQLLQAMYRIDVPEQAFKQALRTDQPAQAIAQLVFNRLVQKATFRQQYKP